MIQYIKVIATTPQGDSQTYFFMGDIDTQADKERFDLFLTRCSDDCADRFTPPDNYDIVKWHKNTTTRWEIMKGNQNSSEENLSLLDFIRSL